MGKSDDFAARLARIKEQTNAPDPTRGTITDPRQARKAQPRSSSSTQLKNMLLQPKLVFGGFAVLALAAFVLGPQSDEDIAAAQMTQESRANTAHDRPETDQRVALLINSAPSKMNNSFGVLYDKQSFANDDGAAHALTQKLTSKLESE